MDYNEFSNNDQKRKTKNVIRGTLGVIGVLIISVIVFLTISKYMKEDNDVDKEKITYTVNIKSNGANIKETELSCFSYIGSCQINLPLITRSGWQVIGFARDENAHELEYASGEVITVSENITLYAITVKSVTISLVSDEDETLSCGIYNKNTNCEIQLPNIGKGWSEELNGTEATYLPGQKIIVDKYKRLYYIK